MLSVTLNNFLFIRVLAYILLIDFDLETSLCFIRVESLQGAVCRSHNLSLLLVFIKTTRFLSACCCEVELKFVLKHNDSSSLHCLVLFS